jgi:hypothetical protein
MDFHDLYELHAVEYILACIPVARQRLQTNNETTAVVMQQQGKHAYITIKLLLEAVVFYSVRAKGL